MMEIVGTVVSVKGNQATVAVRRVSACGENCAHCSAACETTTAQTTAQNRIGAKIGDTVKIESNSGDVVRAAFFLYMVPVLVAIIAAVAAYSAQIGNLFVICAFVILFFASFFVIKRFEKKLAPKSYITKVLGKGVN